MNQKFQMGGAFAGSTCIQKINYYNSSSRFLRFSYLYLYKFRRIVLYFLKINKALIIKFTFFLFSWPHFVEAASANFDEQYERLLSVLRKSTRSESYIVRITADHPHAVFSLSFADESTLKAFQAITGVVSVTVAPLLAAISEEFLGSFFGGDSKGLPYTMLLSQENRKEFRSREPNLVQGMCETASDGSPGYYYQWDEYQIVSLGQFTISTDHEGDVVCYDSRTNKSFGYKFPVTIDYINNCSAGKWNIVDIKLFLDPEKGWSFVPRILNESFSFLEAQKFSIGGDSAKRQALRESCRRNALAAREGRPASFRVEEMDPSIKVLGREIRIKSSAEEDSIEADSEDEA